MTGEEGNGKERSTKAQAEVNRSRSESLYKAILSFLLSSVLHHKVQLDPQSEQRRLGCACEEYKSCCILFIHQKHLQCVKSMFIVLEST